MKGYFIFYIGLIIFIFCLISFDDSDEFVNVEKQEVIFVNISGAVDFPNIYEMPKGCMLVEVYTLASLRYNAVVDKDLYYTRLEDDIKLVIPYGIININSASSVELQELSGVGEVTALKIIDYRNKTPFVTIEDLKNVSTTAYNQNYDRISV